MRILIADSDHRLADIYESYFGREGYDVDVVGDGLQCLAAARDRVPDVLILEYELPWGGGDGVLANLREEFLISSTSVVLISCDYAEEELAHQLAPPVVACLRKPFRLRDLSNAFCSVTQPVPAHIDGGLPSK